MLTSMESHEPEELAGQEGPGAGAAPARPPRWLELRRAGLVRAEDVLARFQVTRAPVDVLAIARELDVAVAAAPDPGWAGAVRSDEREAVIWVRQEDDAARKRFTIAHELGHLLNHPLGVAYRDNYAFSGGRQERQANQFAAQLLVPIGLFDQAVRRQARLDVEALARQFFVSPQVIRIRLEEWEYL